MSHAQTVPIQANVTMTITSPIRHLCPFKDERDDGTITITWRCNGETYELHSLGEYLRGWKNSAVSHEELTDRISHDLSVVPRIDLISVETTWDTAGMKAVVSCGSTGTPVGVTP